MKIWAFNSIELAFLVAFLKVVHHFLTPPAALSTHSVFQHPSGSHTTHSAMAHHLQMVSAGLILSPF